MSKLPLTLVIKDYDYLAPLVCGDVVAEGIDLKLDRDTENALDRTLGDPAIQTGEVSFSRHLGRLSRGDRSFIGIPFFVSRAFRHRCFYVRRGSELRDLRDLEGKRIGTNEWPATGTTWSRAVLREQGVPIESIRWWVGSVDGAHSRRSQGTLPSYVQLTTDRTLSEMLIRGELDALMCPWPPKGFYEPDSPIVRLFPDYRSAEQEYWRRTGIYPAHHIVALRRELFDREPWVARSLYLALEESREKWEKGRWKLAQSPPWLLADIEEAAALMGPKWNPSGVEPNRKMVQTLCDELLAQGLISQPVDSSTVFEQFERVAIS